MRAVLALVLFIPGAHALAIEGTHPEGSLAPDEPWRWTLQVTVPCDTVLRSVDDPVIALEAEEPAGVEVVGPQEITVERSDCVGRDETIVEATYDVVATMAAEAERPHTIHVTATLGSESERASVDIEPELVLAFDAVAQERLKRAGPQKQITFPIELSSASNGRIMVSFELVNLDGPGQVVLPVPLILDPPGGHQHDVAHMIYITPFENGANNEHANFTVAMQSQSTRSQASNEMVRQEITFAADTRGVYVPAPTLAPLLALIGLALWRRAG